jgi:hypothetical protein
LLSAPAYGAEPLGTLVLRPVEAELDPAIVIRAMPVSTQAGFRIAENSAEAHLVQTFRNPASVSYNGIYAITLPPDAAVERLRVRVGARVEDLEPAEAVTSNALALEVKDIGPLQTVVIEIDYVEALESKVESDTGLSVPLTTPAGSRRPVSLAL